MKSMQISVVNIMLATTGLTSAVMGQGQVLIDWRGPTLVSFPQIVSQRMNTVVVVENVNDLLYGYVIAVTPTPRSVDDGAGLFAVVSGAQNQNAGMSLVTNSCTTAVSNLNDSITS